MMNINIAKNKCEQITKKKVVKGVYFKGHYIFEIDTDEPFSTPYYAIDNDGKISSYSPTSDLDDFFEAWDNATIWIKKNYPEVVD